VVALEQEIAQRLGLPVALVAAGVHSVVSPTQVVRVIRLLFPPRKATTAVLVAAVALLMEAGVVGVLVQ
jgi:hypothetical protein